MTSRESGQGLALCGLIGATITMGILSLLLAVPNPPAIRLLLVGWCASVLFCAAVHPLSSSFDGQIRWLPLAAAFGVLLYVQGLRGATAAQIALYLTIGLVGGAVAGALPGRLPALALAASGALLAVLQSNTIGTPLTAALSYAVLITTLMLALVSAMAVTKDDSDVAYVTMLLLLGAGIWEWLRLRSPISIARTSLNLAAPLPSIALAIVVGVAVWLLCTLTAPLWLAPMLDIWILTLRLVWWSDRGSRRSAAVHAYLQSDPALRGRAFRYILTIRPVVALRLLRTKDLQARQTALADLANAAQAGGKAGQSALRVLQAGMRDKDPALWQASLQTLTEINSRAALQACWSCLNDERISEQQRLGVIQRYLASAPLQVFGPTLRDLVIAAKEQEEPLRSNILQFVAAQARERQADRAAAAILALAHEDPLVVGRMVEQQAAPGSARSVLQVLEQASRLPQSPRYRRAIVSMIDRSIAYPVAAAWQACLTTLVRIDPPRAIERVRHLLAAGERAPLLYLLKAAESPATNNGVRLSEGDYWGLLRLLVDTISRDKGSSGGPAAARGMLIQKYRAAPISYAAGMLVELVRMADTIVLQGKGADGSMIAQLYQQRRHEGLTPPLLRLSARHELRIHVVEILRLGLGLDLMPAQQAELCNPKLDLQETLFPFTIRPLTAEQSILHLEETLSEPATNITGSRITVWQYQRDGRVSEVVLAGHANTPVCREVSAKLFNAFIAQSASQGENSLLVPGAFVLRAPTAGAGRSADASLTSLVSELAQVSDQTGLLEIRATSRSYQEVCDDLRSQIEQGVQAGSASVQWRWQPELADNAVIMPFYIFGRAGLQELSLDIPLDRFASPAFDRLLEAHQRAVRKEMVDDALRRKVVYEGWLGEHKNTLLRQVRQAIGLLLPSVAEPRREELAQQYEMALLDDDQARARERELYDWLRSSFPLIGLRPPTMLDEEEIADAVRLLQQKFPEQQKEQFSRAAVRHLLAFLQRHAPQERLADQHLSAQLFVRDIMVSGDIDWANVKIVYKTDEAPEYIDLVTAIYNLPDIIRIDQQWIERMNELLGYIDEATRERKQALEKINLGTLLDSFLRGWPSVFLSDTHMREDYNTWVGQRREQVWRHIHGQLLERGLRIDPLRGDNVVFAIQRSGAESIKVTPYFVTTSQTCTVFLHRHFGVSAYVYPWQYRECVEAGVQAADNTSACAEECAAAERALRAGDTTGAIDRFCTALRILPAKAADTIFRLAWQTMRAPTTVEMASRLALARAVSQLDEHQLPDARTLREFVASYPSFLPDPYLLLAYLGHEQAPQVAAVGQELRELVREWRHLTLDLEAFQQDVRAAGEVVLDRRREYHRNVERSLERIQELPKLIEDCGRRRKDLEQKLWKSLADRQDPNLLKALSLDSAFVNAVIADGRFRGSVHFMRYVLPMLAAFQAQEQTRIADDLQKILGDADSSEGDQHRMFQIAETLKQRIDTHIQNSWIGEVTSRALSNLYSLLVHIDEMTPVIESQIRVRLQEIVEQLRHHAFQQYSSAADRLPELSGPRKDLTGQLFRGALYRTALAAHAGGRTLPLLSAFPAAHYTLRDTELFEIAKLRWDADSQTVLAQDQANTWRGIVQFHGLDEAESAHLKGIIESRRFAIKLNAIKPPLAPAYNLLHAPIGVPPLTERWQAALRDLERCLVCAMAYLGVDPAGAEVPSEVLRAYERSPVVTGVNVSRERVGDRFTSAVYGWAIDAWQSVDEPRALAEKEIGLA